ncbi:YgdI/YgdR family lipoprotein [Pseudomonas sp. Gutcm_11s]|uniref:YgdI/YgdR family lipoprotein n=1 Tax=Pseudomonas sp. Gutcm_11s TaxID=3026088 RepID=UPI00235EF87C|nr:YgdI/YgdR family lipoprotein [Pseudomonas sp. Gutcm_11s]MDD0842679.1 YgdI/YgdR family lipoprotein [Pseudomonas sp. Gutcm_11s]
MKYWIPLLLCLTALSGCASEHLILTTDGQLLTSEDEPELDEDTGMFEFEDSEGRKQQIPQTQVKQIMER